MRPPRRVPTIFLLAAALALAPSLRPAAAESPPKVTSLAGPSPKTVLWIGNSFFYYNNGIHHAVLGLAKAGDVEHAKQYRATSITISGSGLSWHDVESYFRPGAVASYSFVGDNEVVFNTLERPFDLVIMQDCSQCPVHPKLKDAFHEAVRKDARIVREHGATPVLFMTWAYADRPEMTGQLAEQYTVAGNANDALVVPAGLAFARALKKDPKLVLYAADKRHPSPEGTYLAACTTYAAVWGRSPVGNPFTGALDGQVARSLQEVAWEAVREFHGKAAR
jgi:diadenosine tetraphosphatase ApaH/serine/threonine PP2A family protein phosphatase